MTSTTNTMKGTKASGHTCGEPSQDATTRSGRNCLKKGTISLVEYSPLACIAIRSMATRMLARICRVSLRSEEHTSELQSRVDLVCRLLLEKKKKKKSKLENSNKKE